MRAPRQTEVAKPGWCSTSLFTDQDIAGHWYQQPPRQAKHAVSAAIVSSIICFPLMAQAADPLPRAKPEEVGMSSERLALIGKAVNAEIARDQLPGAVLVIARRGKLVYFETFGYRDKV